MKRPCAFLLTLLLLFTLSVPALAVTDEQLENARAKKNEATAERERVQKLADELNAERDALVTQIDGLSAQAAALAERLSVCQTQAQVYADMSRRKAELAIQSRQLAEEQLAAWLLRTGIAGDGTAQLCADTLRKSGALSDFLAGYADILSENLRLYGEYSDEAELAARRHGDYEALRLEHCEKSARLSAELTDLEKELKTLRAEVNALEKNGEEVRLALAERTETEEKLAEKLEKLEKERSEQQHSIDIGKTTFMWPVACTYITSSYGLREHPVSGEEKGHNGVDIGANQGDPVWAADYGYVIRAEEYSGYGNCVMIDHENGYISLYGHLEDITVKNGQYVNMGDVIGHVGSSGVSTGTHLHFEIRLEKGGTTDPTAFFNDLTYAWDA